jgi:glycosyltransferase involved in cell wall biosynthesis
MNPKKIALICNYELLSERVGGMDYFFWMFDKKCKEKGIQVDWFFPNQSQHGGYCKLTIFNSNYQNVENYFLDFCIQNKSNYSYIITHFIELCTPFFKKIKQVSIAKIVAIDHNPRPIYGYPFKKKIEKKIKGFLFSKYIDQFIGVSDYTVKEIISDFGNQVKSRTSTIYNGVLIQDIKVRTQREDSKPRFIVASHLRESKGIQDLILAVSQLPSEILKEIHIDIFGDGPYKHFLIKNAEEHKVTTNFRFMGSQPNLNDLYCQYDYMLQPTHMECFSLSILESLAANVPVITTNVGGNEEVIVDGENGYVFKAKDIQGLKEILEKIYLGHAPIESNTRIVVENGFSLQKMVEQHLALVLDNKSLI